MDVMFKDSKYTTWYFNIISSRRNKTYDDNIYTERHHIIPKSMGGSNSVDNIVRLTVREHILCHILLVKMVIDKSHVQKMWYALRRMLVGNIKQREIFSKISISAIEKIKKEYSYHSSIRASNRIVSAETRRRISESKKGKSTSKPIGFGERVSKSLTGKKKTYDHVSKINKSLEKIRKTVEFHTGRKRTTESKKLMSQKKKEWIINNGCQHNKGYKLYYNPDNIEDVIQCLPIDAPIGWILGDPRKRGRAPYQNIHTREIKRFKEQDVPNKEEWLKWNPNKKY